MTALHSPRLEREIRERLPESDRLPLRRGFSRPIETIVAGFTMVLVPGLLLLQVSLLGADAATLRPLSLIVAGLWLLASAAYLGGRLVEEIEELEDTDFLLHLPAAPRTIVSWHGWTGLWSLGMLAVSQALWVVIIAMIWDHRPGLGEVLPCLLGGTAMLYGIAIVWARYVGRPTGFFRWLNVGGGVLAVVCFLTHILADLSHWELPAEDWFSGLAEPLSRLAGMIPTSWYFQNLVGEYSLHSGHSLVATILGVAAILALRPLQARLVERVERFEPEPFYETILDFEALEAEISAEHYAQRAVGDPESLFDEPSEAIFAEPKGRFAKALARWIRPEERTILYLFQHEPGWPRRLRMRSIGWLLIALYAMHDFLPEIELFNSSMTAFFGLLILALPTGWDSVSLQVGQDSNRSYFFSRLPFALRDLLTLQAKIAVLQVRYFILMPLMAVACAYAWHHTGGAPWPDFILHAAWRFFALLAGWLAFRPAIVAAEIARLNGRRIFGGAFLGIPLVLLGIVAVLAFFASLDGDLSAGLLVIGMLLTISAVGAGMLLLAIRRHNRVGADFCGVKPHSG